MKGAPGTFHLDEITEEARVILKLIPSRSYISGVEVGTLRGKTAVILLHNRPGLHLTCVDDWSLRTTVVKNTAKECREAFIENTSAYYSRCALAVSGHKPADSLTAASLEWTKARGPFDFIYIDADHTYKATAADIKAWWPHVRPSGLLMGHDYGRKGPSGEDHDWGVARAVHEFLLAEGLALHHLEASTWAVLKP